MNLANLSTKADDQFLRLAEIALDGTHPIETRDDRLRTAAYAGIISMALREMGR